VLGKLYKLEKTTCKYLMLLDYLARTFGPFSHPLVYGRMLHDLDIDCICLLSKVLGHSSALILCCLLDC
jgi:hypothetical protein